MMTKLCTSKTNRGTVLLGHGLNLNPEKLLELAKLYNDLGHDVIILTFPGHGKGSNASEFSILSSIEVLRVAVTECKGDYIFCGFSISCLVYAVAVAQRKIPEAKKNIFLAPAFRPTTFLSLARFLPSFLFVPSRLYKDYQVHKGLWMSIYHDLYNHAQILESLPFKSPSLLIVDEGDEALNVRELVVLAKDIPQHVFKHRKTESPRHLLVDRHSLGEESWGVYTQKLQAFLELK